MLGRSQNAIAFCLLWDKNAFMSRGHNVRAELTPLVFINRLSDRIRVQERSGISNGVRGTSVLENSSPAHLHPR